MFGAGLNAAGRRPGRVLWAFGLAGAVLPWLVAVTLVQSGSRLPTSCLAAPALGEPLRGQLLYTTREARGVSLWTALADLSRSRRLLHLVAPAATPSPSAAVSPTATASAGSGTAPATASPPASAAPGPSPSPSPSAGAPGVLAAALAPDLRSALALVANPPDRPGTVSLRLVGLSGGPASELWSAPYAGGSTAEVRWLTVSTALFRSPTAGGGGLVGVVNPYASPALLESGSGADFAATLHAQWPETHDLKLDPVAPALASRATGPNGVVAGLGARRLGDSHLNPPVPFSPAAINELVVGRLGRSQTSVRCGSTEVGFHRAGPFSPDGRLVVVYATDGVSSALTVSGPLRREPIVTGEVFDWIASPAPPPSPSPAPSATPSSA